MCETLVYATYVKNMVVTNMPGNVTE